MEIYDTYSHGDVMDALVNILTTIQAEIEDIKDINSSNRLLNKEKELAFSYDYWRKVLETDIKHLDEILDNVKDK